MSFIIQMQRRAIESLRPEKKPANFLLLDDCRRVVLMDGTSLFPLGISEGIGTCSDIKDINVLVVAKTKPDGFHFDWQLLYQRPVEYAVLVRVATDDECWMAGKNPQHVGHLAVELLRPVQTEDRTLIFQRTDKLAVYPIL